MIDSLYAIGIVEKGMGDWPAAEKTLRKALDWATKLVAKAPEPRHRYMLAEAHWNVAVVLQKSKRLAEACDLFRQQVAMVHGLVREFPAEPTYRWREASARNFLGIAQRGLPGEVELAIEQHR